MATWLAIQGVSAGSVHEQGGGRRSFVFAERMNVLGMKCREAESWTTRHGYDMRELLDSSITG